MISRIILAGLFLLSPLSNALAGEPAQISLAVGCYDVGAAALENFHGTNASLRHMMRITR